MTGATILGGRLGTGLYTLLEDGGGTVATTFMSLVEEAVETDATTILEGEGGIETNTLVRGGGWTVATTLVKGEGVL